MKSIKTIIALILMMFLYTSCSDDFLDTVPTSSISPANIFGTTENAKLAVNGINKLMTRQWHGTQGYNGEGTIKMFYGNYMGNHFHVPNLPGFFTTMTMGFADNPLGRQTYYAWHYYYTLIGNANIILEYIDDAEGPESERKYIKAQALGFRAYSFFMLSQIYGYRWSDSNNGATNGIVLRTDISTGDQALATLGETYQQVYDDLDEAIRLFEASGLSRRGDGSEFYEMCLEVAYAIYARAALTREDYQTARDMSRLARTNYPLMSNSDYIDGFRSPNREWIWGSYGASDEQLHFYSFHAYIAYNSTATNVRTRPKIISRPIFHQIPESDIRRGLFLDPAGRTYNTDTGLSTTSSALHLETHAQWPDLDPSSRIYAYMQFKFSALDMPGVGNLNHFRSSEMLLIDAEACYFLNDEPGARAALVALNKDSGRDPNYATSSAGQALLNEIKFYRAVELWGEGFDWFDHKRWGDALDRKAYADGGNFSDLFAFRIGPEERNQWTFVIPNRETDYNQLID